MREQLLFADFIRLREKRIIITHEPVVINKSASKTHDQVENEVLLTDIEGNEVKNESNIDAITNVSKRGSNLSIDRNNSYKGYLTEQARKRIEKSLQCWFNAIITNNNDNRNTGKVREYLPVMITLTLSSTQRHDDKFIKKHMLQEFIKALQRQRGIRHTFWKAEAQLNNNIHFHVLIDRYVDMKYVQGLWNYYQKKNGYLDDYYHMHNSYNAPSTKITGMRGEKSPVSYVMKYMEKRKILKQRCMQTQEGCERIVALLKDFRRPIQGAIYRFSKDLVELTPPKICCDIALHEHIQEFIDKGEAFYKKYDWCEVIYCKKIKAYDMLTPYYKDVIDEYYRDVFRSLYIKESVSEKEKNLEKSEKKKTTEKQLTLIL